MHEHDTKARHACDTSAAPDAHDTATSAHSKHRASAARAYFTRAPVQRNAKTAEDDDAPETTLPIPMGAGLPSKPDLLGNLVERAAEMFFIDDITHALGPGEGGLSGGMRPDRPGFKPDKPRASLPEQLLNTALSVPVIPEGSSALKRSVNALTDEGGDATKKLLRDLGDDALKPKSALRRSTESTLHKARNAADPDGMIDALKGKHTKSYRAAGTDALDATGGAEFRLLDDKGALDPIMRDVYDAGRKGDLGVIGKDSHESFGKALDAIHDSGTSTTSIHTMLDTVQDSRKANLEGIDRTVAEAVNPGGWLPAHNYAWVEGMADADKAVRTITDPSVTPMFRGLKTGEVVPSFTNIEMRELVKRGYTVSPTTRDLIPAPGLRDMADAAAGPTIEAARRLGSAKRKLGDDEDATE